ncbi:hypothetical protein E3Q23_00342 [Wallemia mellicola]|nr:hypothetical protein E3Q23_00342 [Wallemia mellicola]
MSSSIDRNNPPPQLKRLRLSRACDRCRKRKVKCDEGHPCQSCIAARSECTFVAEPQKPLKAKKNIAELEARMTALEKVLESIPPSISQAALSKLDYALTTESSFGLPGSSRKRSVDDFTKSQDKHTFESDAVDATNLVDKLASLSISPSYLYLDHEGNPAWAGSTSGLPLIDMLNNRSGSGTSSVPSASEHGESPGEEPGDFNQETYFPGRKATQVGLEPIIVWSRVTSLVPVDLMNTLIRTYVSIIKRLRNSKFMGHVDDPRARSDPNDPASSGKHYFTLFSQLRDFPHNESGNVYYIQATFLAAVYLIGGGKLAKAFALLAESITLSIDSGLHRSLDHYDLTDKIWSEIRKRTFWSIFCWDKQAAAAFGRPPMIRLRDCDLEEPLDVDDQYLSDETTSQPANQPSRIRPFIHMIRLHVVLERVLDGCNLPAVFPSSSFLTKAAAIGQDRALESAEELLQEWRNQLPEDLKYTQATIASKDAYRLTQSERLHCLEQLTSMLVYRHKFSTAAIASEKLSEIQIEDQDGIVNRSRQQYQHIAQQTALTIIAAHSHISRRGLLTHYGVHVIHQLTQAGRTLVAVVLQSRKNKEKSSMSVSLEGLRVAVGLLRQFAIRYGCGTRSSDVLVEFCRVCQIPVEDEAHIPSIGQAWLRPVPLKSETAARKRKDSKSPTNGGLFMPLPMQLNESEGSNANINENFIQNATNASPESGILGGSNNNADSAADILELLNQGKFDVDALLDSTSQAGRVLDVHDFGLLAPPEASTFMSFAPDFNNFEANNDSLKGKTPKKGILKSPPPPSNRFPFISPIGDLFEKLSTKSTEEHQEPRGESSQTSQSTDGTFWGGFKRLLADGPSEALDTAKTLPNILQQQSSAHNSPPASHSEPSFKRVAFHLPAMTVTYPIHASLPPKDSQEHRQQVENAYREQLAARVGGQGHAYWTNDNARALIELYRDSCRMREESPRMELVEQLRTSASMRSTRSLDLSGLHLSREAVEPLADVLSVDWGLQRLILEDAGLTDDSMKPILHALLISGSLPWLSLANNKSVKEKGWKYLSVFIRRAHHLAYVDLSENVIDKKSAECIMAALARQNLRHDDQNVPREAQETENHHVSSESPLIPSPALLRSTHTESSLSTIRLEGCTFKSGALEAIAQGLKNSALMHLSLRRNKISPNGVVSIALMLKDYADAPVNTTDPFSRSSNVPTRGLLSSFKSQQTGAEDDAPVVSSPSGSVTTRKIPATTIAPNGDIPQEQFSSPRLEDSQDRLDLGSQHLLRHDIGSGLITLDLKGNDIRSGVNYIATVLKRNKTLKVLNLSENRIDYHGLLSLSEALKHNHTLETLDLSKNPCCGPESDGITSLRTSFTVNSNMKRLFLADTQMQSEGAIALAEFLPEARTLLHIDLTENDLTMSGLLALSVAVKMNESLRCLDISIPINDPEMARLSQDILQSCIRNTEAAQEKSGKGKNLFGPIERSLLAKKLQEAEVQQTTAAVVAAAESPEGMARASVWNRTPSEVLLTSQEITKSFTGVFAKGDRDGIHSYIDARQFEVQALKDRLMELIAEGMVDTEDEMKLALSLNDDLEDLLIKIDNNKKRTTIRSRSVSINEDEMSNPHFQIMGSDDSDAESIPLETTRPQLAISTDVKSDNEEETPKPSEDLKSPTSDLSRSQLFEEGEIFRKGTALLDESRIDGEEDGEALRKEILETELPNPPPKSPTTP